MSRRRKPQLWGFTLGPDWIQVIHLRPRRGRPPGTDPPADRARQAPGREEVADMSAALRRPATWVLAAALIVLSQTGTRCGDAYRPDMTGHQVVIDR